MVSRDRGKRRPVDARWRQALRTIGVEFTKTLFVHRTGQTPQLIEPRSASGVECLNGKHCDIAVLRIYPRACWLRRPR